MYIKFRAIVYLSLIIILFKLYKRYRSMYIPYRNYILSCDIWDAVLIDRGHNYIIICSPSTIPNEVGKLCCVCQSSCYIATHKFTLYEVEDPLPRIIVCRDRVKLTVRNQIFRERKGFDGKKLRFLGKIGEYHEKMVLWNWSGMETVQ